MDPDVADFLSAWHSLEAADRAHRKRFAAAAGIGLADYQALVLLAVHDGTPSGTFGPLLGFDPDESTALIGRLETAGYVTHATAPDDHRARVILITDKGRTAIAPAEAFYVDAAMQAIPPHELAWTTSRLRALTHQIRPR